MTGGRGSRRECQRGYGSLTLEDLPDHCEDVGFHSETKGELLQDVELNKRHDLNQVLHSILRIGWQRAVAVKLGRRLQPQSKAVQEPGEQ